MKDTTAQPQGVGTSALFAVAAPVITKIVDQFRLKSAKDWVDENSQSGAFDCVGSCVEAEKLVRAIQEDVFAKVRGRISACIKPGKLKGDGLDEHAERNGLILAQYCLDEVASANSLMCDYGGDGYATEMTLSMSASRVSDGKEGTGV